MLVNHQYRFIFIKTKKTGSSSTEVWLRHYCTADNAIVSPRTVGRDDPRRNHSSAREVHALVGEDVWQQYRSIVNVRNPWDKLASLLFFRPGRTARFGSGSLEIADLDDARRRLDVPGHDVGDTDLRRRPPRWWCSITQPMEAFPWFTVTPGSQSRAA